MSLKDTDFPARPTPHKPGNLDQTTVFITLGSGNEFGISDSSMFIRSTRRDSQGNIRILDLGPPTRENFQKMIGNMRRLECHMKDE